MWAWSLDERRASSARGAPTKGRRLAARLTNNDRITASAQALSKAAAVAALS